MKFPGRQCGQIVLTGSAIGLTLLPLVFIVHELTVSVYQTKTRHKEPRGGEIPVILRPDRRALDWREELLRQLKSDLLDEINGIRSGSLPELLACHNIDTIDKKEHLGRGVTKEVYRGVYRGRSVALKMVTDKVEDIKACRRRNKYKRKSDCYVYANYKLVKEMALTMQVNHPNIVKVHVCRLDPSLTMTAQRQHWTTAVVIDVHYT
ncbi:uncharacterized protein LOC110990763 [Acanthaster planci]|uniref:Uncharacterized protein LOC110990763 n=1 Tax=Acanthaster planci TaxID=133434 RepID=A0A8B8A1D5_ACAPL|nr:uncharacterized protein LOC110990763 [Acanthaster planci]